MSEDKPGNPRPPEAGERPPGDWETTRELLLKIKGGDRDALDRLYTRYLPPLRTWASHRLPQWARGGRDTDDLVQDALTATLKTIDAFELRHEGALHAYMRQAVRNRIRTLVEKAARDPGVAGLASDHEDPSPSQLEMAIGREAFERYERALAELSIEAQSAIMLRVEMGYTYAQIARALDKPTDNAARMTVTRALLKLTEKMRRHGD